MSLHLKRVYEAKAKIGRKERLGSLGKGKSVSKGVVAQKRSYRITNIVPVEVEYTSTILRKRTKSQSTFGDLDSIL